MQSTELDNYFSQLNIDKEKVESGLNTLLDLIDKKSSLSDITTYLERGDGERALHYLSDVRRVWCMLRIALLEGQTRASLSFEEYLEEYELILLTLRRLVFQMSEKSCLEAINFLRTLKPSQHKIAFILQNEQMSDNQLLKVLVPEIMKDV